jgi:hypothetical protein
MTETVPTLADLTPAFLGDLLGLKVASVGAKPIGTGQVGATYRLTLGYDGPAGPPTLVAKLPSNDPLSRATGKSHMTYIRESRFYQNFAGKRPMAVPDHLFIVFDEESHDFALIMHDLPRHMQGDQLRPATLAEARLAMAAAASIHAGWWGDPTLDTLEWLNGTKAVPPPLDIEALYAMFWPAFRDRYGGQVTEEMRIVGDAFMGRMGGWSDRRAGPRCLTHNDFRPDNMLYNLEDVAKPIVIVDWQTVGVGPGAGDIAYYAGTALDPGTRRAEEVALIDRYKAELVARGVIGADLDAIWDDYRASAVAGFLMGVTASMVVQQTDRGDAMFLAMAERSAAMVFDHRDAAIP